MGNSGEKTSLYRDPALSKQRANEVLERVKGIEPSS
jgi:hypothetical protein